jgi:type VI secretion system secreted protein Hcp
MATRMYLQLGDIKGSSIDAKHKAWIEVDSFGYGVSNSVDAVEKAKTKPGGEACSHSDLALDKTIDKTSTQLYAYCAVGKEFPKAIIDVCEEEDPLFKISLEKVYLASIGVGGGTGGVPSESIVLSFAHIAWQYKADAERFRVKSRVIAICHKESGFFIHSASC